MTTTTTQALTTVARAREKMAERDALMRVARELDRQAEALRLLADKAQADATALLLQEGHADG